MVRGEYTIDSWGNLDAGTWVLVTRACGPDMELRNAAANIIESVLFEACVDGDDPPSVEEQTRSFQQDLWRELLVLFGSSLDGARYAMETGLRELPWVASSEDYAWAIHPTATGPKLTYMHEAKDASECHKLLCINSFSMRVAVEELVSSTPITQARVEAYLKQKYNWNPTMDFYSLHDVAALPVDLDQAEKGAK